MSKDYGALQALDEKVRPIIGDSNLSKIPDKSLFQSHAPYRVDVRKTALEGYFFKLITSELLSKTAGKAFCEFLSTDTLDPLDVSPKNSRKEGYLTKRGKKAKTWEVRYFAIEGDFLNYYQRYGEELQGSIYLRGAKIGRQTRNEQDGTPNTENAIEKEFRHAFLLVEPKKKEHVRHVLCAETDEDRELWIEALLEVISQPAPQQSGHSDSTSQENTKSVGQSVAKPKTLPGPLNIPIPRDLPFKNKGIRHSVIPSGFSQNSFNSLPGTGLFSPAGKTGSKPRSESSSGDLRPTLSLEDEFDSKEKKHRKKGFFSAFRTKGNTGTPSVIHDKGIILDKSSDKSGSDRHNNGDKFYATPYSAVEQKNISSAQLNINPNPHRSDTAALHALGLSLEEAITQRMENNSPLPFEKSLRKSASSDAITPSKLLFGAPLHDAISISNKSVHGCVVPSIVYRCIELLKIRGAIFEEGIFRLSGSTATIRTLKERFNNEFDIDLVKGPITYDIHAVAGLLKLYLREIPTLILCAPTKFRETVDISDPEKRVSTLSTLVSELPKENRDLLCVICSLLTEIIAHADVNKMNLRNVGIVFAPTLNISASVLINFLTDFDNIFGNLFSEAKLNELSSPTATSTPSDVSTSTKIQPESSEETNESTYF